MCPCDYPAMRKFSDEFKVLLSDFNICERWPAWIDKVIDFALGNSVNKDTIALFSQNFCQKWSYFR